jgi:hypothetical protein
MGWSNICDDSISKGDSSGGSSTLEHPQDQESGVRILTSESNTSKAIDEKYEQVYRASALGV